jgi:hypothetical protein
VRQNLPLENHRCFTLAINIKYSDHCNNGDFLPSIRNIPTIRKQNPFAVLNGRLSVLKVNFVDLLVNMGLDKPS